MKKIEFKQLEKCMLEEIVVFFVGTFNSVPWNEAWTHETAYLRLCQIVSCPTAFGLVCCDGGHICGVILGIEEQDYNGAAFTVREFCIANHIRGQGMGTKLYIELENQLQQRGVKSINLLTLKGDLTEVFYQKNGFVKSSEIIFMDKYIKSIY